MNLNAILPACGAALFLTCPSTALAGINGTYKVSGTEKDHGKNYSFTGTVVVSKYKTGKYDLKFNDGDKTAFTFAFKTPLKDKVKEQTVEGVSNQGTAKATFTFAKDVYKVNFTYKSKDGSVSGSGKGTKAAANLPGGLFPEAP